MIGERPTESPFGSLTPGRYAVLTMDGLSLMIPQHEVHTLEPRLDEQRAAGDDIGWIAVGGNSLPVYCLSGDLAPIREVPASRKICVLLKIGDGLFGLLCDQVTMLDQVGLEILPLPDCMRTPDTPVQGLTLQDGQVLCVTSAQLLLTWADKALPGVPPDSSRRLAATAS